MEKDYSETYEGVYKIEVSQEMFSSLVLAATGRRIVFPAGDAILIPEIVVRPGMPDGGYLVLGDNDRVIDLGRRYKREANDEARKPIQPNLPGTEPEPEPVKKEKPITFKKRTRTYDYSKQCKKSGFIFKETPHIPGDMMECTCGRIVMLQKRGVWAMIPNHYHHGHQKMGAAYKAEQAELRETFGEDLMKLSDHC